MHQIHLSAECYPAAKVGGLADVVGALPKYMNRMGEVCEVVIPKYDNLWIGRQETETVFDYAFSLNYEKVIFQVQRIKNDELGYPLYVVNIPGKFDRPGVYVDPWTGHGYWDEFERFLSFQIAVLEWIKHREKKPDVIHCHDHHTGLVPFMMAHCNRFRKLNEIPTVLTVHNAEYHGEQPKDRYQLLPAFNIEDIGLLDWDGKLNSLAAGLKTAWKITTVSENYMDELSEKSSGLEYLFAHEKDKSQGIINGIDVDVWDPSTDSYLYKNYSYKNRKKGKEENKKALCEKFGLNPELPTFSFIGRLVREKGADLLPDLFKSVIYSEKEVNFILLGTGDPQLHEIFASMEGDHIGYFDATLEYNEELAHQMYAGSDFLLMPSRVEPCGLNQMYAMRYGTIPVVRETGGLSDTVKDISEKDGYGITFKEFSLQEATHAIERAVNLYYKTEQFNRTLSTIMKLDFSWERSANKYLKMYNSLNQ